MSAWGDKQGRDLFEVFERNVFRLETLPVYTVPQEAEAFRAFKEGRPLPPDPPETTEWRQLVKRQTGAGKRWYRVHVVDRPLTDYLRYEFVAYARSAPRTGEEIYIAGRDTHPDLAGLTEDFWLFDEEVIVRMHYDDEGHFIGPERVPSEHLDEYLRRRDLAMKHAVPLEEYAAKHGDRLTA